MTLTHLVLTGPSAGRSGCANASILEIKLSSGDWAVVRDLVRAGDGLDARGEA